MTLFHILCFYLIIGIIVLEMVRPDARPPAAGILRAILLWPVTVFMALLYLWGEGRGR